MIWKDWLAFSRREQYGIVFLAVLVVLFLGLRLILPRLAGSGQPDFHADSSVIFSDKEEALEQIEAGGSEPYENRDKLPAFNPNLVSVTRLDEMGVASYAIVNWMKYREAGGKFEHPRDIRNVYGLDSALAVRLEASAIIGSSPAKETEKYDGQGYITEEGVSKKSSRKNDPEVSSATNSYSTTRSERPKYSEKVITEINNAGAADFQKLKGIGEVYSNRIVAFREALGGFFAIEQLSEVYGISRELFESIRGQINISSDPYRKISVNRASIRKLKQHPYIDFYQARDIIEYRRENGDILKSDVLQSFSSFSPEQIEKILPYLSFVSQNEGNLTEN